MYKRWVRSLDRGRIATAPEGDHPATRSLEKMKVMEARMERRRNERAEETEEPRKSRRRAVSSGMIPTSENLGATRPKIEPGSPRWEVSRLTAQKNQQNRNFPKLPLSSRDLFAPQSRAGKGEAGDWRNVSSLGVCVCVCVFVNACDLHVRAQVRKPTSRPGLRDSGGHVALLRHLSKRFLEICDLRLPLHRATAPVLAHSSPVFGDAYVECVATPLVGLLLDGQVFGEVSDILHLRKRHSIISLDRCRNARAGETGDPRENPPTSGIVRHDSHLLKFGLTRPEKEFCSPCWVACRLTAQPPWPGFGWKPTANKFYSDEEALAFIFDENFPAASESEGSDDEFGWEIDVLDLGGNNFDKVFQDGLLCQEHSGRDVTNLNERATTSGKSVENNGIVDEVCLASRPDICVITQDKKLRASGRNTTFLLQGKITPVIQRPERLPPTMTIRARSPARSPRIFACRNRAGQCHRSAAFLGISRFPHTCILMLLHAYLIHPHWLSRP
ncbi:hypothetical protein PR048_015831 [Dryococelus australis]|uniref:Uncharacterized protein n=1 Tax=Dryococelus australis TaxID=614101 RepID=A0ABQ9HIC7_9NEOP|nr:hypothetical protein PR048_015831 [Dryococelus australis]